MQYFIGVGWFKSNTLIYGTISKTLVSNGFRITIYLSHSNLFNQRRSFRFPPPGLAVLPRILLSNCPPPHGCTSPPPYFANRWLLFNRNDSDYLDGSKSVSIWLIEGYHGTCHHHRLQISSPCIANGFCFWWMIRWERVEIDGLLGVYRGLLFIWMRMLKDGRVFIWGVLECVMQPTSCKQKFWKVVRLTRL